MQVARTDAAAGRGGAGSGVGGRHVGIGAVVDVQQRALGAFEQQVLALALDLVQQHAHIHHQIQSEGKNLLFEGRSEEHTSELQSRENLVCRLLLEKKK